MGFLNSSAFRLSLIYGGIAMANGHILGEYLIDQLANHGVGHVFGIPGDYVLSFYDLLSKSEKLEIINTCDEQGAGFAADAYARLKGLGAVCITYGVGGLKVANTTAQAYAEKSPVIIISGAPGVKEQINDPLLHHKVRDFQTQKRVFDEFTVASAVLDNADNALCEIDRLIHTALKYKRPVYLELPRDMVFAEVSAEHCHPLSIDRTDDETLDEALSEAVEWINKSSQPVILAGVEIHRFGLQEELAAFATKSGIPVAATILSKSVVADSMPLYMGIYEGATGLDEIQRYVESSDCLIILGALMTDLNLGIYTAEIDPKKSIYITSDRLSIKRHLFEDILFEDFINGLGKANIFPRQVTDIPRPHKPQPITPGSNSNEKLTVERLFQHINSMIDDDTIVVADVGDALFGANDLYIHQSTEFLSPAYYASLGFAVPGGLGAQLAMPEKRPLILVGDGAFQMTGMELSAIARYGLNPIVIVINNKGYSTERPMLDGPFNDIHPWHFYEIPKVLGVGIGYLVETEEQLIRALQEVKILEEFSLIDVAIGRDDRSPALNRLTSRLANNVKST